MSPALEESVADRVGFRFSAAFKQLATPTVSQYDVYNHEASAKATLVRVIAEQ